MEEKTQTIIFPISYKEFYKIIEGMLLVFVQLMNNKRKKAINRIAKFYVGQIEHLEREIKELQI